MQKVLTFERFYEKIGTNPVVTNELYYLTKPGELEHYSQSLFQRVNFGHDYKSGIDLQWKNNIAFYCLVEQGKWILQL